MFLGYEALKTPNYIWIVSTDATVYEKLKNYPSFVINPTEEEVRAKIRQGEKFNVLAPYFPPRSFEELFITEVVREGIFSKQERWYIEQLVKQGKPREKVEMEILEKRTGIKIYKPSLTFSQVIGMRRIKELKEFIKTFPYPSPFFPKAILLVGVPGTGKSLTAKAIAGELDRYLVEINLGKLLESDYPTTKLDEILSAIERLEMKAVLWIDEIEKAIGDDEKSKKLIGRLLTVLQEFHSPTGYQIDGFFWVTANDISVIAERYPELLRSGRFSRIFFIDFPKPKVAKELFSFYFDQFLKKQLYSPELAKFETLLKSLLVKHKATFLQYFLDYEQIKYAQEKTTSHIFLPAGTEGEGWVERLFTFTPAEIAESVKLFFLKTFYRLHIHHYGSKEEFLKDLNRFLKGGYKKVIAEIYEEIKPVAIAMKDGIAKQKGYGERFTPAD